MEKISFQWLVWNKLQPLKTKMNFEREFLLPNSGRFLFISRIFIAQIHIQHHECQIFRCIEVYIKIHVSEFALEPIQEKNNNT